MKILILATLLLFYFASCTYVPTSHSNRSYSRTRKALAPGQAKKMYGSKSAKPFAPGQQKKHRH